MKMKYNFSEIIYHVIGYWKWFAEINASIPLIIANLENLNYNQRFLKNVQQRKICKGDKLSQNTEYCFRHFYSERGFNPLLGGMSPKKSPLFYTLSRAISHDGQAYIRILFFNSLFSVYRFLEQSELWYLHKVLWRPLYLCLGSQGRWRSWRRCWAPWGPSTAHTCTWRTTGYFN